MGQYHTSSSGKIRSFNFPDITYTGSVSYKYVHLSNQHYKSCVRKNSGKGYICYWPCTTLLGIAINIAGSPTTSQPSFGLSLSPAAGSQSAVGMACTTDYVTIPQAVSSAIAVILNSNTVVGAQASSPATKICGRYFNTVAAVYAAISICSLAVPFELGVDFDNDEFCT